MSNCVNCDCKRFIQNEETICSTYTRLDICVCGHSKINHSKNHPINRRVAEIAAQIIINNP